MAATKASADPNTSQRAGGSRSKAKQAASQIASTRRIFDTSPNCVSFSTVDSTSHVMASRNGSPLIDAACS